MLHTTAMTWLESQLLQNGLLLLAVLLGFIGGHFGREKPLWFLAAILVCLAAVFYLYLTEPPFPVHE